MKPTGWLIAILLLLLAACLISLALGPQVMFPRQLFQCLTGQGDDISQMVFWQFRLPRLLLVVLVGASVSVSGVLMQCVLRNDLADPGVLGVATGGSLGVTLTLLIFGMRMATPWLVPGMSILGAFATVLLVCSLAIARNTVSPSRLLLTGIAVSAALGSFTLALSLNIDRQAYAYALMWATGSFAKADWNYVAALAGWLAMLSPFMITAFPILNILRLQDDVGGSLGVSVFHWRLGLLGLATALGAASMAMAGGIVFLGLIGPHIARRLSGTRHQTLVPTAAAVGSCLLLAADTAGRTLFAPVEIPAGIMIGAIGGAYFLYLLAKSDH